MVSRRWSRVSKGLILSSLLGREVIDRNPNLHKVEEVSELETVSLNCLPSTEREPHGVEVSKETSGGVSRGRI